MTIFRAVSKKFFALLMTIVAMYRIKNKGCNEEKGARHGSICVTYALKRSAPYREGKLVLVQVLMRLLQGA